MWLRLLLLLLLCGGGGGGGGGGGQGVYVGLSAWKETKWGPRLRNRIHGMCASVEAGHHLVPLFEIEFVGLFQCEGEMTPEYVLHLVATPETLSKTANRQTRPNS